MVIGWRYTPSGCMVHAPPGGCTRGVSAERFETPLVGGAARLWRLGGNPPAPAFPRRGKRERGSFNSLLRSLVYRFIKTYPIVYVPCYARAWLEHPHIRSSF